MKDKVAYKQQSRAENPRQAIKEVWVTEITQKYRESLVSSLPPRIQAAIDRKGRHTKCCKEVILTLLDIIKFQIVLCYAFGEINI